MVGVLVRLKPRVLRDSLRGRQIAGTIADKRTSGTEEPS